MGMLLGEIAVNCNEKRPYVSLTSKQLEQQTICSILCIQTYRGPTQPFLAFENVSEKQNKQSLTPSRKWFRLLTIPLLTTYEYSRSRKFSTTEIFKLYAANTIPYHNIWNTTCLAFAYAYTTKKQQRTHRSYHKYKHTHTHTTGWTEHIKCILAYYMLSAWVVIFI